MLLEQGYKLNQGNTIDHKTLKKLDKKARKSKKAAKFLSQLVSAQPELGATQQTNQAKQGYDTQQEVKAPRPTVIGVDSSPARASMKAPSFKIGEHKNQESKPKQATASSASKADTKQPYVVLSNMLKELEAKLDKRDSNAIEAPEQEAKSKAQRNPRR